MSDEPPPPFSGFRNARPARKTAAQMSESELVNDAAQAYPGEPPHDPVERTAGGTPKRKRRTRAEIEASTRSPLTPPGELAVLKACLKQLRSLDDQARARTLVLLKAVFE